MMIVDRGWKLGFIWGSWWWPSGVLSAKNSEAKSWLCGKESYSRLVMSALSKE